MDSGQVPCWLVVVGGGLLLWWWCGCLLHNSDYHFRQSQSKKMQADHHAHIEKMLHVAKQSLDSTFIILTIGVSVRKCTEAVPVVHLTVSFDAQSRVLTILWKCLERELRSTTIASVYKEHLCREALLVIYNPCVLAALKS